MRAPLLLPVALALLAALLSGCFWGWGMHESRSGPGDPEFAYMLLVVLLLVGAVLVAVNLSGPRPPPPPPAPPTPPAPPSPPSSQWEETTAASPAAPEQAAKPRAAKARRRQP